MLCIHSILKQCIFVDATVWNVSAPSVGRTAERIADLIGSIGHKREGASAIAATASGKVMMNYDAEYDNRVRVPGYADIFARWRRQAADYRVACSSAEVGLSYGSSPRQTLDIFPALNRAADPPVALFIHGGWWRSLEPETFSHMAMGPNANGVTVAVAGYDLVPQVSIGDIVTQMRAACLHLWRRYRKRIAVYGHSAGGHLSACMIATDWTLLDPSVPRDLVHSAYSISGVFDLRPVMHTSMNTDFKLDDHSALALSPIRWKPPRSAVLDAVVGALESSEFLRQSKAIVDAWSPRTEMRYDEIPGTDHFTVLDAFADPASRMTRRVCELASRPL